MNDGNAAFLEVDRNISIKYLYFYFLAITAYLRGYSQGMGQPNLNTTIIGGLILPKPSLAEQHQIVEHCVEQSATVDILITKIQGVKTQLLERRAALISAAVTGKIDVTR